MTNLSKVADPLKVVTDPEVIKELDRLGIDKDYVEFRHDYGPKDKAKARSPYMKSYLDLVTKKHFSVVSALPKTRANGDKIAPSIKPAGSSFVCDTNLFECEVQGDRVYLELYNDQPNGARRGDYMLIRPTLKLGALVAVPLSVNAALLPIDPINPNYRNNTLVWNYGVCLRYVRVIEGKFFDVWEFPTDPKTDVSITYAVSGSIPFAFGRAMDRHSMPLPVKLESKNTITITKATLSSAAYPVEVR